MDPYLGITTILLIPKLLLHNGSLVLKITRADQTTEQKVIASIDS